ncbi:AAA family ATPase [Roseomonas alkaliterrae]|uniref:AAA family ATPase n=1 Tax=Neoroseomonas alkaliterrae TaxID=1452450 RepID=UPI001BA5BA6F|nr:AAA family ATPase [Neoroseomonas alkaliterrae]
MSATSDDNNDFAAAEAAAIAQFSVIPGGRRAPLRAEQRGGPPPLWVESGAWDESAIPPRPWLARGYLLRGSVTVLAGVGSAGKSSLCVSYAVALALGMRFGRFEPAGLPEFQDAGAPKRKVLLYNVEDDDDEQRRRLSAALRQFGAAPADLDGHVFRCGPASIGTLLERDAYSGAVGFTDAWHALEGLIAHHKPDLVVLDPLVELHTAEENDNTALRAVIAHLRGIAQRHRCALVLVHHTRKGAEAGDMEGIRGAGSIVGAARIALTCAPMTREEADALGVPLDLRRRFFRVDNAKANYSPATEAAWHELTEYELDNGDYVAAAVPWKPQDGAAAGPGGAAPEALALLEAEVARGTEHGPYSPRLEPHELRSVAAVMARLGIEKPVAQRSALRWLMGRGFTVQQYRDAQRRIRKGLRAHDGGPEARWLDAADA